MSVINNRVEGGPWTKEYKPFTGYYEKSMVDIIDNQGKEYKLCWPNAGYMNCSENKKNKSIPYSEVSEVKLSDHLMWRKDN